MTNKDKALALINTFATGDTDVAKNLLAEGYIQHNTGIAIGVAVGAGIDSSRSSKRKKDKEDEEDEEDEDL